MKKLTTNANKKTMEEMEMVADEAEIYKKETSMKRIDTRTIIISILSGGCAGLITDIIYFPLDTIKTRLQATSNRIDFVKKTQAVNKFKGVSAILMVSLPYAMTFFLFYDKTKQLLSQNTNLNGAVIHILGAAAGETSGNIVRNPFEVVKQQMQVGWNASFISTAKEIKRLSGPKGFYAGYFSLLLREIPFSCIQFPIYEYMKKKSLEKYNTIGIYSSAWNGFVSASIAAFLTNPIDVVKSRLMTQRDKYYTSTFGCFKTIHKEEGWKGFLRGAHVRVPSIGITGVIFFGFYERFKLVFDKVIPKF